MAVSSNVLNMSNLTLAMDLGAETTADMPEDTDTIPTERRTWEQSWRLLPTYTLDYLTVDARAHG